MTSATTQKKTAILLSWAALIFAAALDLSAQAPNAGRAQTSPQTAKPVAGTAKPAPVAVPCPDPIFQKACKSYDELRRAGDPGVRSSVDRGGFAYLCFREPEDEFFVVELGGPTYWSKTRFDPKRKISVPEDGAEAIGLGWARAFVGGVEDGSAIPLASFSGKWKASDFVAPSFQLERINREPVDTSSSIFANDEQIWIARRYNNRFGTTIDFELVIRRSTGRFSETYQEATAKTPFSRNDGRCLSLSLR